MRYSGRLFELSDTEAVDSVCTVTGGWENRELLRRVLSSFPLTMTDRIFKVHEAGQILHSGHTLRAAIPRGPKLLVVNHGYALDVHLVLRRVTARLTSS